MIEVKDLTINYGSNILAVKNVSFTIQSGTIVAIIGPNGSGKSTLIKGILGLVRPSEGKIHFFGRKENQYTIGYMPQTPRFPINIKVKELISFFKKLEEVDKNRFEKLFSLLDLKHHMDKKIGTLSGGTKQKISILQCFSAKKDLYVIDEPTASLDPYISHLLKNLLIEQKNQGSLVLFSTHILSELQELADRFLLLSEGSILIDDTPKHFLEKNNKANLDEALMNFWNEEYKNKV
ncbi:ATP-binding protein of an ABC transporter complex [Leptospira biflexa serovar Patoc strain 'Patoc 1 (Ames)']|uniref:ABC transporter, ATP-binding protein n=1 Tax=Leptospira biflexa serovar Patoc (strain Patoc 1 / ATCC 23582 / Paris) TaxID=456481 RepID=B0SIY7_LEPBP|nr:ABC transporter ATP-binding protein [Leptospira biflexa]ABZ92913.1 ATP-binding protein of an ABC transporter complex [Leptospira biflexa serovar Patoc strain 'Patoc 1 (Ames)']ABZ96521.1 ABC transporter, ATP-binding protein [Leptospira biflexa serovar Patoc strain 'Patoc 1 (Paris)']TGM37840.1 ABC transporter ATP-binding protein [Leptospira biflexa]TGM41173.1 ABC transporter ATP-binding protein [Leptospira biflexa]TGM55428.1 ABC transporter ATP-binding protein [Leptospira biflexa]